LYNCISDRGNKYFKPLVETYSLLHNINEIEEELIDRLNTDYKKLYNPIAFNYKFKNTIMSASTLTAVIHKEKKFYVAECPEVGTVSQGLNIEEAVSNLKEATELYLEEFPQLNFSKPIFTTFEAEYA